MTLGFDKARWTQDADGLWMCLRSDNPQAVRQFCKTMEPGKKYEAEIRKERKKRSLDANAYFWVLAGKLAAKLHVTTQEIYFHCIQEIGDNFKVVPIAENALDEWERIWKAHGIGWFCEDMGPCRNTPGYHNVKSYYGSSVYNTRQMSCLIDLVVQECQQQEIETKTPDEIALMKARWEDEQHFAK